MCGRTFNPEVLARHEGVCKKNNDNSKKRKKFDSSKQRLDHIPIEVKNKIASSPPVKQQHTPKADWKRKHEEFISSIRAAREVTTLLKSGAPLPPPKPSAPNPDYQQCPYCERRFQDSAAERHIPFCKEQASRKGRKVANPDGQDKLNKRMQYKPPLPRRRSGSVRQTVDGYHPGNHVVTKNSNFAGRTSEDIPHTKSAGMLRGHKPPTPPGHKQPLGRTRIINTNEVDHSATRHQNTRTPQRRQKPPSQATTEIIDRSMPRQVPSPLGNGTSYDNTPLPTLRHLITNGRTSSGSSTGSNPKEPINQHGMLMSKFCYECGTKYPVPQAKYCCECGTKRI